MVAVGAAAPASIWLDCQAMAERVASSDSCCPAKMAADHSCCAGGAAATQSGASLGGFDASCCSVHPGTDAPGVPELVVVSAVKISGTSNYPASFSPASHAGFTPNHERGRLHGPPSIPILNSSLLC
ncbi:MAG: hypothetical protein AAB353_10655 [Candidatus Hydrogenedentota bacterium]